MTEPREVVAQQWGNETIDEYIDHHAYVGMSERQMADRAFRGGGASVIETTTAKILMRSMRNNLRATIDAQAQEIASLKAELVKAHEDKAFWEKYGQTRMMDLVEARAEIDRLKDVNERDRNAKAFVAEVKLGRIKWGTD